MPSLKHWNLCIKSVHSLAPYIINEIFWICCFIVFYCVLCVLLLVHKKAKSMHLHIRICNLVLLGIFSAFPPANGLCSNLTLMPFNRYSQNSLPNWTCNVSLCTAFWLLKGISVILEPEPFSDTRTVEMLGKNKVQNLMCKCTHEVLFAFRCRCQLYGSDIEL